MHPANAGRRRAGTGTTRSEDDTRPKTLWSQTQFELLYQALDRNKPEPMIKEIVLDLARRGFPAEYLLARVRKKMGMVASNRLKLIIRTSRA